MIKEVLLRDYPFKDIKPLLCGEEKCRNGHAFGPATRPYYLLHYVLSGKGRFESSRGSYNVKQGEIFVIHPFEVTYYEADQKEPWHYCWVGFELDLPIRTCLEEDVISLPQAEYIFKAIKESDLIETGREFYICSKIYELLIQVEDRKRENKEAVSIYIDKAKNYIMANYMKPITIEGLAEKLGLERSYFSNIFKKKMGKSPQAYLVEFRLTKAAELMGLYDYKPGEAATSVGYHDLFNFSKMFKKKFGISPTEYKKNYRHLKN